MHYLDSLFDAVAASFETGGTRLRESGLLLLRGGLLLLLPLLCGCGILPAALSAGRSSPDRGAGTGISAERAAHDRTTCGTTHSCARRRSRCCRRGRGRGLWRWRFRGVETTLLNRPGVAGRFIALLLLRRLPLGGVYVLLGASFSDQEDRQCQQVKDTLIHYCVLPGDWRRLERRGYSLR